MRPAELTAVRLRPLRTLWDILVATYESWRDDRTIRLGAGLAYYGLFSLTSVLAISIAFMQIIGRSAVIEDAVTDRVEEFVASSPEAAQLVDSSFELLSGSAGTSIGIVGLVTLLVTGSLFFLALEDAVHQIFDVPVRAGFRFTVQRRLVSLVVLLGAGLTLVLALAAQAVAGLLDQLLPGSLPSEGFLTSMVASALGWGVLAGALTLLFKYLPTVDVPWRVALTGAALTGVFMMIGAALIGWYLRTVGASSIGGAASTPIAILVWIYYEAQILLAGIQLTKVLTERANGHDVAGTSSSGGVEDDVEFA